MKDTRALDLFPKKRVKPFDGMSVTAEVWAQAHDEHRMALNAHTLVAHGSGIITGLEIVANDPPDQYVFISPGAAVDPAGNIIVVPEQVAYDFGSASEGKMFLVLGQGERELGGVGSGTKYIQNEFVIAARPSMPARPAVELARITLSKAGNPVKNAEFPLHPGKDMLDLRFRPCLTPIVHQAARVLVIALGAETSEVLTGWDYLGNYCQQVLPYHLIVDAAAEVSADLEDYDLVYLAGKGKFKPNNDLSKALKTYWEEGKVLIIEALDSEAQESCQVLLDKLTLLPVEPNRKKQLFSEPYLFVEPPAGFSGNQVQVWNRVVYSTAAYALSWSGLIGTGMSSRSYIRSVHEWGVNLISYCLNRTG
jgi:hypothetical protein